MPAIQAVLFDMDGVLIAAREWHFKAFQESLARVGIALSQKEHQESLDGLPTLTKLERLSFLKGIDPGLFPTIFKLKQEITTQLIVNHCRPNPQITKLLSDLKACGYRLGVCSNSVRDSIRRILDLMNLTQYFEFFLSNQDVKSPKPHPEIYTEALNRLQLYPREALVIEDNPNGVQAAKSAGTHVLVVQSPAEVTTERVFSAIEIIENPWEQAEESFRQTNVNEVLTLLPGGVL